MADCVDRMKLLDALYAADAITMRGMEILRQLPAADVVEVVRCKDCIYSEEYLYDGEKILTCNYDGGMFRDVSDTDYCSGGVKREVRQ